MHESRSFRRTKRMRVHPTSWKSRRAFGGRPMHFARKRAAAGGAARLERRNRTLSFVGRTSARHFGAVVIGGDCGALGVARSLGRKGIPVIFLSDCNPLAAYSRYTVRHILWPGANHPDAAAWLLDLAHRYRLDGWTLFPAADAEVRLIAHHHADLSSSFRLCTPPWETTKWAGDKHLTYQKAAALGIDHPRTYSVSEATDLATLDCRFPLILKPAVKEGRNALTNSKAWQVDDHDMLARRFSEAAPLAGSGGVVVQELIPGDGSAQFSYAAVCKDGRPVVSMVARRTRQHPADFGTGTYVETVEDDCIEAIAERFLAAIGYSGTVEMEFKMDSRDASFKLLDVNPRVWTWNSLGTVAGVDFPLTMWRMAVGDNLPRVRARAGAAWVYVSRDLPGACREMLAGKLSPITYLRCFGKPMGFAAFAADDPVPALIDLALALKRRFVHS
jgi:D-aspartate ligase